MPVGEPVTLVATPNRWPPRRSRGGEAARWASLLLGVLALASLGVAARQEPGAAMLLLVVLAAVLAMAAGVLALWALSYHRLEYLLQDDGLEVTWLGTTVQVPYAAIDGVYTGQRLIGSARPTVPIWPGIFVGPGRAKGTGRLRFFATSEDPAELTLITVENTGVVLSARDPQAFRGALIQRIQQLGDEAAEGSLEIRNEAGAPWTVLRDRWAAWTLGISGALLLLVLAAIGLRFSALPETLPLRFDAGGRAIELGSRGDLFRLPLGGAAIFLVNWALSVWLHAREAQLARVVWVGTAALQAILLVAAIRLVQ